MFLTDRDRREALVLTAVCVVVIAMFVAVVLLDTGNQDQPDPIEARSNDGAEIAPTSTSTAPSSSAGPEVTTSSPPPPDTTATTAAPSGSPTTRRGTTSTLATAPSAPPDPQDPGLPTDTVAPDTTLPSAPSFGDPVVIPRTVPPTTTQITQPTSTTTATTRPPPLTP